MKRKITVFIAGAAALAIALLAASLDSSASSSPYSSPAYGYPATTSAAYGAAGAAKVGAANSPLGRILVDGKGRTLYLFEKDKNRRSACYGQCATYWPPLLTRGKPAAGRGVKGSLLGVTRRAKGTMQVTYAGHPLYRYLPDTRPGQTYGQGSRDFGGRWYVVSPAGKKIPAGG
jgi:predicted lipoprotein with Yx(FWY)xxD motif